MKGLRVLLQRLIRRHGAVKCFAYELRAAGQLLGRADAGLHTVAVDQIVGSVGRWQSLRADFLSRDDPALTERHRRIAAAMQAGKPLPAVELYRLSMLRPGDQRRSSISEYYVVDGHHRVAMARRLGQAYLDAHIVEYRVAADGDKPADSDRRDEPGGPTARRGARRRSARGGRPPIGAHDRSPSRSPVWDNR